MEILRPLLHNGISYLDMTSIYWYRTLVDAINQPLLLWTCKLYEPTKTDMTTWKLTWDVSMTHYSISFIFFQYTCIYIQATLFLWVVWHIVFYLIILFPAMWYLVESCVQDNCGIEFCQFVNIHFGTARILFAIKAYFFLSSSPNLNYESLLFVSL